jgi:hypothetical protein
VELGRDRKQDARMIPRYIWFISFLASLLILNAAATAKHLVARTSQCPYVVLIGQAKMVGLIPRVGDAIGFAGDWIEDVKIDRVLYGKEKRKLVRVIANGHTRLTELPGLLMVLSPNDDGTYDFMGGRQDMAEQCGYLFDH